ncbi:MAG TPA: hypothetical protein VIV60_18675 [Polyangiaceae bacterium]
MSDMDPTDLVCKACRQPLTELEARRLDELVATNLEARLMYLMLPEFERAGRLQRGDDALAIRIAERALARTTKGSVRRIPRVSWLLAAAILMGVTAAAGAWWTVRPLYREAFGERTSPTPRAEVLKKGKPKRLGNPQPNLDKNVPEGMVEAAPTNVEVTPTNAEMNEPPVIARERRNPANIAPSAADLFSRANLMRRDGRNTEALQLYRSILDVHPSSREAPLARLALAKSLSASKPDQALSHYQELARSCKSLRAEALWGISETAAATGQRTLRQQALSDLLREFPESSYAAVARQGLSDAAK